MSNARRGLRSSAWDMSGFHWRFFIVSRGFPVTGFDIDERKVSTLNSGGSYIFRITPAEIQRARKQGFSATSDYAQLKSMDAIIICVPTPLNEYHEPDLSFITETANPSPRTCVPDSSSSSRARPIRGQPKKFWFRFLKKETSRT